MATFSIFETVKITDPKVAEAFVNAIEESERKAEILPTVERNYRMATKEDRDRLFKLWKKNWRQ